MAMEATAAFTYLSDNVQYSAVQVQPASAYCFPATVDRG